MRRDRLFALTIQLLCRTKTAVGATSSEQAIGMFAINFQPLRLPIGSVRAFTVARLPGPSSQSKPSQRKSSNSCAS